MDFDWNDDNRGHIARRNIRPEEVEQALTDPDQVDANAYDVPGQHREARIGRTETGRLLFVVYTELDDEFVRPISVRNANRREAREYRGE